MKQQMTTHHGQPLELNSAGTSAKAFHQMLDRCTDISQADMLYTLLLVSSTKSEETLLTNLKSENLVYVLFGTFEITHLPLLPC